LTAELCWNQLMQTSMSGPSTRCFARVAIVMTLAFATLAGGCALLRTDAPLPEHDSQAAFLLASQRALEYLPDRESLHWVDPETEHASRVTVLQTLPSQGGVFCRLLLVDSSARPGDPIERYCRQPEADTWLFDRRLTEAEAERALAASPPQASL
jgi:surface antigen